LPWNRAVAYLIETVYFPTQKKPLVKLTNIAVKWDTPLELLLGLTKTKLLMFGSFKKIWMDQR